MQKDSLSNRYKKIFTIKKAFYFIMIAGIVLSLQSIFITQGKSLTTILFFNEYDSFMDFFNPINYVSSNPYARGDIYPPLAYSIYLVFSKMLPSSVVSEGGALIRSSQLGLFLFAIYTTVSSVVMICIIRFYKKGKEMEKFVFSIIILFSAPFLFILERANMILIALIFLILFTFLKESENKYLRELSYVCLAISAAIKIYPAIFALLLVKEKKNKETIRCAIYTILLFVLPFFFFNGLSDVSVWFNNLQKGIAQTGNFGFGYQINYANFIKIIFAFQNHYESGVVQYANIITFILVAISLLVGMFIKSKWKTVCLLSLLCVGFPSISYFYAAIFMVIPLILFLDSKDKRSFLDVIYLILFAGIFLPLTYGDAAFFPQLITAYPLSITCFTVCLCVFVMTILLISEGIVSAIMSGCRFLEKRKLEKNLS